MRLKSSIALFTLCIIVAFLGSVTEAADVSSSSCGCLSQTRSFFLTPILSSFLIFSILPIALEAKCTRVQSTTAQPNRQVLSTPAPTKSSSSSSMVLGITTLTNSTSPTSTADESATSSASASSAAIHNEPILHGILVFLSWVWFL